MKYIIPGSLAFFGLMFILTSGYLHAQDDEEIEYYGEGECGACHRDISRDYERSAHALALSDDPENILADFEQGEEVRTVTFPGEETPRPFTAEDVALVMGKGRYVQRYVYQSDEVGYRVFPAEWNTLEQRWQPLDLGGDWLEADGYNWLTNCAGCHTTGLDVETGEWVDDGVQCEACHGPGKDHIPLVDELPRRASEEDILAVRASIVLSPDPQICGQCHSQGMANDGIHRFPVGYRPGQDLQAVYSLVPTDDRVHWWASGHGKSTNMQFNEWLNSAHATALRTMQGSDAAAEACLSCHSGDYSLAQTLIASYEEGNLDDPSPVLPTLGDAQFGVSCTTCHNPHLVPAEEGEEEETAQHDFFLVNDSYSLCVTCHTATDVVEGIHHPVQQMFEGQDFVEGIEGIPSPHFANEAGPRCQTCHMPRTPVSTFSLSSHALRIIAPAEAEEGQTDTCSQCHASEEGGALTQTDLQFLIDDVQEATRNRLTTALTRLAGLPKPEADSEQSSTYEQVLAALTFVQNDGSLGVHNYPYTDQLLSFAERNIVELSVAGTTIQPTEAPAPTAIPDELEVPVGVPEVQARSGFRPMTYLVIGIAILILLISAVAFFRKTPGQEA
jgi:hypothetical protein